MAKRYHQNFKDRMHEHEGMRHHERAMHRKHRMEESEHYAGMEPRRRQELEDAGMIREDHSAIANMPQGVVMRPYPKSSGYMPEVLDDTIRGIDRQIDLDDSITKRDFAPKKV